MAEQSKKFTPTYLNTLPATGKAYWVIDKGQPLLRLRITARGDKSFFMWKRWRLSDGSASARTLGPWGGETDDAGKATIEAMRAKAMEWDRLRLDGIDPKVQAEETRRKEEAAAEALRVVTFGSVMADYLKAKKNKGRRQTDEDEADLRRDCLPLWKETPITSIGQRDIEKMIDRILERGRKAGARTDRKRHAHNVFVKVRALFNWAVKKGKLEKSPCDLIDAEEEIGEKKPRERELSPDEIFAFLRAVRRMPYPYGPMYHLLALTGARLREISDASWPEVDLAKGTLTIPASRFKSKRPNTIALSTDAAAVLSALPRWEGTKGDPRHFLFSAFNGSSPINGMSKSKGRLDAKMLRTLRALARRRGEDASEVTLPGWVIHDLRRVVRTGLSELRVAPHVAELVMGHTLPALWGTYDKFTYLEEKREALEKWAAHLRGVVDGEPKEADPPTNVVPFMKEVA